MVGSNTLLIHTGVTDQDVGDRYERINGNSLLSTLKLLANIASIPDKANINSEEGVSALIFSFRFGTLYECSNPISDRLNRLSIVEYILQITSADFDQYHW